MKEGVMKSLDPRVGAGKELGIKGKIFWKVTLV